MWPEHLLSVDQIISVEYFVLSFRYLYDFSAAGQALIKTHHSKLYKCSIHLYK